MLHKRPHSRMWCTVVLLKHEQLTAIACDRTDVFLVARYHDSGICGVFDNRCLADKFIASLRPASHIETFGDEVLPDDSSPLSK